MTQKEIEDINKNCPSDQGIFVEPYGIPVDIKEPVIYSRYETGGYHGGSCWGGEARWYENEVPQDRFKVLDLVLEKLYPNISYLQYKKIDELIHNNEETEREYYGNSTNYKIEYIILSELELLLDNM